MARSRNIKPSLFQNEILGVADPILTLLFESLWCLADREGRLEDRPLRIKGLTFPYREIDAPLFNRYLTELQRLGFIERYAVGNQGIIQVVNFKKHQSPHKTERPSELPERPINSDSCRVTVNAPLNNESLTVKESLIPDSLSTDSLKEQAAPKKPARKTQLKIETLPDEWEEYCKNRRPELNPEIVFENFRDFYLSHGRAMQDWTRTWQRWVRNEKPNGQTQHRTGSGPVRETAHQRAERIENETLEKARRSIQRRAAGDWGNDLETRSPIPGAVVVA